MLKKISVLKLCLLCFALLAFSSFGDSVQLIVTGDVAGTIQSGTNESEVPILAKRASIFAEVQKQAPLLLMDAGNAFFGAQSLSTRGKTISQAYDYMSYDIVNMGFRDFRLGKQALEELCSSASFTPVSANLYDKQSGKRLFDPYVKKEIEGKEFIVLGLTERPPGINRLPHFITQFRGVEIRPAAFELNVLLPDLIEKDSQFILLYYGSHSSLEAIKNEVKLPADTLFFVAGDTSDLLKPKTVQSGLTLSGTKPPFDTKVITFPENVPPDSTLQRKLNSLTQSPEKASNTPPSEGQPSLPIGKRIRLFASDEHQGMGLTVYEWQVTKTWQGKDAPKDVQFLIMDVEISNQMAIRLREGLEYNGAVQVASLRNKAFLIMNQRRILRHPMQASSFDGHLPDQFILSAPGRSAEGQLVFEIPTEGINRLEFILYHDEFPALSVTLFDDKPATEDKVTWIDHSENEAFEWGVYDVNKRPSPTEGYQRVSLDIRGRSKMSRQADSAAIDPRVPVSQNQPIDHAIPLNYQYFFDLIALWVPEGKSITANVPESEFSTLPSFLPDRMAGGRLVFDIPNEIAENELRLKAWFPTLQLSGGGGGQPMTPTPLELKIQEGSVSPLSSPLITFPDGDLAVEVLKVEAGKTLFNQSAPEGRKWVRIRLKLINEGDQPGFMSMQKRFGFSQSETRIVAESPEEIRSPYHPGDRLYLPANDERVFELVFKVPEEWESAYFDYRGITENPGQYIDFNKGSIANTEQLPPPEFNQDGFVPSNEGFSTAPDNTLPQIQGIKKIDALTWETPEKANEDDIVILPPGTGTAINLTDSTSELQLTAHRYFFLDDYYGEKAKEGQVMLAIDVEFSRIASEEASVTIPYLNQRLPIRLNGSHLISMTRFGNTDPQLENSFTLDAETPSIRNFVFYTLPRDSIERVDLVLTQEIGEPALLPIIQTEVASLAEALQQKENQIAELGLFGFGHQENFAGDTSTKKDWFVVDLRGTSKLRDVEIESDPENTQTHLYHWRDWKPRMQLILNGTSSILVEKNNIDRESRLLPGVVSGGQIAFKLSPEEFADLDSVVLQCGFAPTAIPNGKVRAPKTLYFTLKGPPDYQAPQRTTWLTLPELNFDVDIIEVSQPETVRGKTAASDSGWVKVDLGITATAEQGVFFKPGDFIELIDLNRNYIKPFNETWHGPNAPPDRGYETWIPQGGRREFSMYWQVKQKQMPVRLRLKGMQQFRSINLFPEQFTEEDFPINPDTNLSIAENGVTVFPPNALAKGIEGVGLTPEQVNNAIDKGRDYLWSELQKDIQKYGKIRHRNMHFPSVLALTHCKAHLEYPEFDRALRIFIQTADVRTYGTYVNAVLAKTIEAYGDPAFIPKMEEIAHYLVETQGEKGTWNYRAPSPEHFYTDPALENESTDEPVLLEVIGGEKPEEIKLPEGPIERTQSWEIGRDGDHSNTQFAVLGLWSAERSGVPISDDVWKRVLSTISQRQIAEISNNQFGGYGYSGLGNPYGSMTAAGICTLAVAMDRVLTNRTPREHLRIRNSLAWLAQNFDVKINPLAKKYNYYYIYSLERVGNILGTEFIGGHEWYPLGAKYLVNAQKSTGNWPTGSGEDDPLLTTSFALLFLTRATPSLDSKTLEEPKGPGRLETNVVRPDIQHQVYLIFDSSGSMRPEINGVSKIDIARNAVMDLVKSLPEKTRVALRAYGHQKRAIDPGAEEDTELILPWAELNSEIIQAGLSKLSAKGKTPLALSLQEALKDIPANQKGKTLLVLLTDGGEDNRNTDPVAAAASLAGRDDINFFILGFDINRRDWTQQLSDMAKAADGIYLPVEQADRLTADLISVVWPPIPEFSLRDADENEIKTAVFGSAPIQLTKGNYNLKAINSDYTFETEFYIRPQGITKITLNMSELPERTLHSKSRPLPETNPSEAEPTSSFCTNCGSSLKPGTRFCTSCGTPVN